MSEDTRQEVMARLAQYKGRANTLKTEVTVALRVYRQALQLIAAQVDPRASEAAALAASLPETIEELEAQHQRLLLTLERYQGAMRELAAASRDLRRDDEDNRRAQLVRLDRLNQETWEGLLQPGDKVRVHWLVDGKRFSALARFVRFGRGSLHVRLEHGVLDLKRGVEYQPNEHLIVPRCGSMTWSVDNGAFDPRIE